MSAGRSPCSISRFISSIRSLLTPSKDTTRASAIRASLIDCRNPKASTLAREERVDSGWHRLLVLRALHTLMRMRVRPRGKQREQRDGDEVLEGRLRPVHVRAAVREPVRVGEEDDAGDHDLAGP